WVFRRPVRHAGSRNEHVRGSPQGGDSQASQEVSRTLPPGNRGYRGRSRGSGVRAPVSGVCAYGQLAEVHSWVSRAWFSRLVPKGRPSCGDDKTFTLTRNALAVEVPPLRSLGGSSATRKLSAVSQWLGSTESSCALDVSAASVPKVVPGCRAL